MIILALLFFSQLTPDLANVDYRQPQLAVENGITGVTFGSGNTVYFAASSDSGRTFSKPVKVAEGGVLSLGRHRGPRIAITPQAIVISAVVGQKGKGADGDLVAWRSTDRGRTWSRGVTVNDTPAAAREGLHTMAAGGKGLLYAAWLDDRAGGKELYGAYSTDGGATWSRNVLIYHSPDGHICECCHPSALVDGAGGVYVMWRNWLGGSRDFYLAHSIDGGRTFQSAEKLGAGTWKLNACPMDGGGIALTSAGKLVSAWRREDEVFFAAEGRAEDAIGKGKDPAIAAAADGVYIAWTSPYGVCARVPGKNDPVRLDDEGGYAQLTALPDGSVLAAWEAKGSIRFRNLR